MQFKQSRMATKIEFNFEEEELEYSMQDNNSDLTFEVRYGNFPKRTQKFFERNEWLRNVGLLWIVLGVGLTILNFVQGGKLSLNFWVYIGGACLLFYRATWSEYIYFDTDEGRVLVLNDKQCDKIIHEIMMRRKSSYIDWFNNLEFNGDKDAMQKTLNYMVKEKAMTKPEAQQELDRLSGGGRLRLVSSNDDPPKSLH